MADRKLGKGKEKIDDEDITFQRMVAKVSAIWPSAPISMKFTLFVEHYTVVNLSLFGSRLKQKPIIIVLCSIVALGFEFKKTSKDKCK